MRINRTAIVASGAFAMCVGIGSINAVAQSAGASAVTTPTRTTASAGSVSLRSSSGLLPGTRPTVFSSIQGNALTSTNGAMSGSIVRLRDARVGRIVNTVSTDNSGLFAFRTLDPGSYIVEIVNQDSVVIATSQIVHINAGEVASTIVKLPFRIPPFAGLLGESTQTAAAQSVVAAAGSTGLLTSGPLDVCVSGPCQ